MYYSVSKQVHIPIASMPVQYINNALRKKWGAEELVDILDNPTGEAYLLLNELFYRNFTNV